MVQAEFYLDKIRGDFPELRKIFDKLSSGEFINRNSTHTEISALYRVTYNNRTLFKKYYFALGFDLIIEDGFCYFANKIDSEKDENVSLEDNTQINKIIDSLVSLNFFKTILDNFGSIESFEFTISSIDDAVNNEVKYRNLIPREGKNIESNRKYIEVTFNSFLKNGYIELIDKKEGRYKTLCSLDYLKNIADQMTVEEE